MAILKTIFDLCISILELPIDIMGEFTVSLMNIAFFIVGGGLLWFIFRSLYG